MSLLRVFISKNHTRIRLIAIAWFIGENTTLAFNAI